MEIFKNLFRKRLSKSDLNDLREMNRAINAEKFKYSQVKGNTVLVHKGQQLAEQMFEVIGLLEKQRQLWISLKLTRMGFKTGQQCLINENGVIVPIKEGESQRELVGAVDLITGTEK